MFQSQLFKVGDKILHHFSSDFSLCGQGVKKPETH